MQKPPWLGACQPSRKNGLKGSIIALFHALPCVCQKYPRWWIGRWNLRLVKVGFSGPWYCLIQCQAGGQNKMCTLIYWAKLVPLLHINIDEGGGGGESFGGQLKDLYHISHCFLIPTEVRGRGFKWLICMGYSFNYVGFSSGCSLYLFILVSQNPTVLCMWLWIDAGPVIATLWSCSQCFGMLSKKPVLWKVLFLTTGSRLSPRKYWIFIG